MHGRTASETSKSEAKGNVSFVVQVRSFVIDKADEFSYKDVVDGSVSEHQGIRFLFSDGSRVIFRLSGMPVLPLRFIAIDLPTNAADLQADLHGRSQSLHYALRVQPDWLHRLRLNSPQDTWKRKEAAHQEL